MILTPNSTLLGFSMSGMIAGLVSAFLFAVIHEIYISDIWFSIAALLAAGALCGLCVAWSYRLFSKKLTFLGWWRYNLIYVALFILLGTLSVVIYEPVTTVADLIVRNEPPRELIRQAMPLTIIFILGSTILISMFYSKKFLHHLAVLLTNTLLVLFLGLNVSLMGLVFFPGDTLYLILEMYVLIIVINISYAGVFMLIQWSNLKPN